MKQVIIFASGSGTNAENLIRFFQDHEQVQVIQVLTNNPHAKVIERCKKLNVSCFVFNRTSFFQDSHVYQWIKFLDPALIVLAGFLWKIPEDFTNTFKDKIVNIHPALLPKYGGKGMYGKHVHDAVIANGEKESGITIHYVNENYDEGAIIFQASCPVRPDDTPEDLAAKINALEMKHFPKVVESVLLNGQ